eukprot:TRINITY_DN9171_c0_g2_i2.p4 TRINITY_DN9171_c0_g2~~TRINITY_DN9171_c0_g2_i2.p4  ORF type:complete len:229 (+),score=89.19 TRINITY_DN9171_c0_g2_i2:54-740(+)
MSSASAQEELYDSFHQQTTFELRSDILLAVLLGGAAVVFVLTRKKAQVDEPVRRCAVLTANVPYDVKSTTNSALAELMNSPAYKKMREEKERAINDTYNASRRVLAYASTTTCFVGAFLFLQKIVVYEAKDELSHSATLPCVCAGVAAHIIPMLGGEFFIASYIAFTAAACLVANYHVVNEPHVMSIASGVWAIAAGFVVSVCLTMLDYRAASKRSKDISILYNMPGC